MMFAVVFLSLIAVSLAQVPERCDAPKQWEARRVRVDREKKFEEIAFHAYDELNMRTRSVEEIIEGVSKSYYEKIHLHREKKEYTIDLKTKKCNVTALDRPFRMVGVPPGSKFVFMAEFGPSVFPNEHLTAMTWEGTFDDGAYYAVTVTSPNCVPMAFDVKSNATTPEYFHERYFDLRVGITEPERFIPPPQCVG